MEQGLRETPNSIACSDHFSSPPGLLDAASLRSRDEGLGDGGGRSRRLFAHLYRGVRGGGSFVPEPNQGI